MPAASTSAQPLVYKTKRHKKKSWWTRKVSEPLARFSPAALWSGNRGPGTARSIYINTDLPESFFDKKGRVLKENKYDSNQNVTSKYTVITFLPRNLLEQFRRIANIFFLAIAILQFFPKFSTISPGLVILPLLAVLAITALKDGYEDIKRHQADHKVNHSIVHVLGGPGYENKNPMQSKAKTFIKGIPLPKMKSRKGKKGKASTAAELEGDRTLEEPQRDSEPQGQDLARMRSQVSNWNEDPEAGDTPNELGWHRTIWEDIKVGDVVKIYENEQFPADIAILATSEEEDVCYIETKNLDGETNLKSRHGINDLSHLSTADACSRERLRLDLDAPDVNMYRLNGAVLTLDSPGHDGQPAIHPITLETTLLRGCVLKNTAWVTGIVLFTGGDTKIIRNSGATPSKRSKVERQMNPQVLLNLSLLGLIAMVCAIIDHFNEVTWYDQNAYWEQFADTSGDNPNINGLVTFANAFITFQNIVPISLYISIEFVRTAQAAFIYWDHAIKYVKNGVTTRTTARSWNLSDDLGQIEYIFSDKTGTLTQNAMIFRQCSVGGKIYKGDGETPAGTLTNGQNGEKDVKKSSSGSSDSASSTGPSAGNDDVKVHLPKEVLAPFHDAQLDRDLEDHDSEQSRVLHGFFAVLGLCHTVLAAEPEPGVIEYKAQSPDEAALVQSAADVGFVFRGRDHNIVKLSTPFNDEPDEYELLHVLEFNSTRKRMSVILRKMDQDGRIFLLVKGADNIIFDRLNKDAAQKELRDKTDKDLQYFASEGLRTLCLAYRVIDPQEYEQWARDYHDASVALNDREGKVEAVSARIEQDLVLLGATAIEDKLQDGVPEAISDLKRAGIKVWVATGDKLETAVAIGYTTHLLTPDTNLIIVREGAHSIQQQISDALETFFGEEGLAITRTLSRASVGDLRPRLDRVNTGVRSLVGGDNGTRPGGFSLVIDGHALTHAFDDEETNDLLLALSTRCVTVICCRVSPLQKAQIVRLIKDNLGVMCLAIGDGANDVSMIQAADVGVGISGEEGLQAVNSSDYAIAQFRYLKRLLFVHGHWSYYRNSNMILNFFYKNIIGIGVLFWYQIYCGWSTTYVFAYVYLLFWNVFWTIAPVIAIGLFDRNADAETLMALPELYRYGREQKYYGMRMFIYYIMEGWYQAAVIYFFLHFTYITTTARGDGYDVYIYEMSTTMAIAAVMVANLFHALNIDHWNWWTLGAIALGPFLVWVFTAVYSVIPPSSFYTGVYGNDVFLFRSAFFWFGVPFVVVVALLPRYLYRTFRVNLKPNDMETMRLVRRYRSDINPYTHPLLAGKLQEKGVDEGVDAAQADAHADVEAGRTDAIPMSEFEQGYSMASQPSSPVTPKKGRTSLQSQRSTGRFGQNPAARGSQVDMSTGLSREPSRGFDFTVEEGGVAIQRMQSRLSETSRRRQPFRLTLKPITAGQATTASNSDPWGSRIRQRAGSVLSIGPLGRKRANTGATTGTQGSDTADQPQPRTPRKGSILGGSRDPKTPSKTGERKGSKEKDVREGKEAAAEQREKEEIGRAERDDEEGSAQGMGRALGAGQQYAPPEVPRV